MAASALLAMTLVSALGGTPTSAASSKSPLLEMQSVIATGSAQRSLEWTSSVSSGPVTVRLVSFAATTYGCQVITYVKGGVAHRETVRLLGGVAYVNGDSTILTYYMGLNAKDAKEVANEWISIARNNVDFAAAATGLTVKSVMSEARLGPPVTAGPSQVVDGVRDLVLEGKTIASNAAPTVPEVLYTNPSTDLPAREAITYQGVVQTITFSSWNGRFTVKAPDHSVPLASSWLQAG